VAALRPLDLHHRDPRSRQVAGEPSAVAAGSLHSGAPYGPEPFRPREEVAVASDGRRCLRLAQAPAQVVEDHRHMEVQVCVHPQHHLNRLPRSTHAAPRHSPRSFRCRRQLLPDDTEDGRYCEGSCVPGKLLLGSSVFKYPSQAATRIASSKSAVSLL
jgi:hypothetical protein